MHNIFYVICGWFGQEDNKEYTCKYITLDTTYVHVYGTPPEGQDSQLL